PDNGMKHELIDGKVIEMAPPGAGHGGTGGRVSVAVGSYVLSNRLGEILTNDAGVIIRRGPDTVLGPDISFISYDRLPERRLPERFLEVVPDLIIEIVSPSDGPAAVRRKTRRWLEAGARLVWTLYPRTRTVVVSQPDAPE